MQDSSLTRLNCPRKKGPSSNLERAVSIQSNAAPGKILHFSLFICVFRGQRNIKGSKHCSHQLHLLLPLMWNYWLCWMNQCRKTTPLQIPSLQDPMVHSLNINYPFQWRPHTNDIEDNLNLTSGKSDGSSKWQSIYLIKSRDSPFTSLLCSSEGTCTRTLHDQSRNEDSSNN